MRGIFAPRGEPARLRARLIAVLLRAAIGLVLAFLVIFYGYSGGGGPDSWACSAYSPYVRSLDVPSVVLVKDDVVPLIGECRVYDRDGRLIGRMSYPEPQYYVYAIIAFALPFAIAGLYRRRPRRPEHVSLLDRMFPRTPRAPGPKRPQDRSY
jgi:hypothetical protein